MRLKSYTITKIDSSGVYFDAFFEFQNKEIKKSSRIQSSAVTRDTPVYDENGNPVIDRNGNIVNKLDYFYLYDPQDNQSIKNAIVSWADAYINGKMLEMERDIKISKEVKEIIGQNTTI